MSAISVDVDISNECNMNMADISRICIEIVDDNDDCRPRTEEEEDGRRLRKKNTQEDQ